MNFPHHNYLGPGNKIENGKPVDSDDLIAYKHDQKYELAKTPEDVIKADAEAINAFHDDWKKNDNWHSLIGKYGLLTKSSVEIKIGRIIYPKLMNIHDNNDTTDNSNTKAKGLIQKSIIFIESVLGENSKMIPEDEEFENFIRNCITD